MKKILIFGAGSIGNHMTHACLKLGLKVYITDISEESLKRMKSVVYPKRYGSWNEKISIINYKDIYTNKTNFDLLIIGTPPITHFDIFFNSIKYLKFKKILIEKPLAHFLEKRIRLFKNNQKKIFTFCGYNHSLSPSFTSYSNLIKNIPIKNILLIDVEWKEGWKGILGAHFWLKNEFQSYLGNIKKGGGALHEHSHGLHLLICILSLYKIKLKEKKTIMQFKKKNKLRYDLHTCLTWFEDKFLIKYETNLISEPSKKKITIDTVKYKYFWINNYKKNIDAVIKKNISDGKEKKFFFQKTRSSEFENEIKHILKINDKKSYLSSNININKALLVHEIISKTVNNEK